MDKALVGAMDADKVALGGSYQSTALGSQLDQISWFPSFVLSVNEVSSMDIYHYQGEKRRHPGQDGIFVENNVVSTSQSDIAVSAMDDAARRKIPTIVCHALDSSLVLAREGHICKFIAIVERPIPDARH